MLSVFNRGEAEPKGDERPLPRGWFLWAGHYGSMLLGFSAILLVWIGAIYFSYSEWLQTERAAHYTAENLARALEEQVNRTIGAADQTLLYVRDSYVRDPQHFDISLWAHDTQFLTGVVMQVAIANKRGLVVADNIPGAQLGADLSDRDHFKIQAGRHSDELYISKPVLGRISHRWSIQLTRRITMPDGSFGGVVIVSLDPEYISHVYQSIDIGKEGTVTLLGSDGIIRARRAGGPSLLGTSLATGEVFEQLRTSDAGFYTTRSLTDGVDRIFAFRKVKDFPLIITVGLARDEVFRNFEQNRQKHFAIAGVLTLWLFGATFLMGRYQEMLARARDAAENGTRARSEFLAMMSHEIRTPMNGVIGMADLLLGSGLSDEQFRYASTLRESAAHLLKIINDVLDFSKLELGRIQMEKIAFKVRNLVKATVGLLDAYAKEKNLALTVNIAPDVPEAIVGDPGRLRQVLLNFVGNGLKFTATGGVTVGVAVENASGRKRLAFTIADTGIGIPADAKPLLFRKFSQLDSSIARRFGGTGLGLAICKRLIDIMGGTVAVESEVGKGTTFKFTIDYLPSSPDVVEPEWGRNPLLDIPVIAAPCQDPLQVLLVEDNKTNQLVATKLIESLGHRVDVADNGAEALTACAGIKYDAIFMDVMMPGMDGLAVTRAIRKLKPPFCDAHIIALTANVQKHHMQECRAAGMDDFLPKPVTRHELALKLNAIKAAVAPAPVAPLALSQAAPAQEATVFSDAIYNELADALGPDGIRQVLEQFLADVTDRIEAMREAAKKDDVATIEIEAHASKSAAASLGFLRFAELSEGIERDAYRLTATQMLARIEEFKRQFGEIDTIARGLSARATSGAAA